jgi:hypothetical protein
MKPVMQKLLPLDDSPAGGNGGFPRGLRVIRLER